MVFENVDFYSLLNWFEGAGGFDIILPFLLIFTITFAILQKIKLFGEKRNIDMIISLIIAFFLIIQKGFVEVIQGFLPRVSMAVLVFLMLLLVVGIFVGGTEWTGSLLAIAVIVAIITVFWALGAAVGWNVPYLDKFTEQDVAVLITVGVFLLVIWLIVREPNKGQGGFWKSLEKLAQQTKGGK